MIVTNKIKILVQIDQWIITPSQPETILFKNERKKEKKFLNHNEKKTKQKKKKEFQIEICFHCLSQMLPFIVSLVKFCLHFSELFRCEETIKTSNILHKTTCIFLASVDKLVSYVSLLRQKGGEKIKRPNS